MAKYCFRYKWPKTWCAKRKSGDTKRRSGDQDRVIPNLKGIEKGVCSSRPQEPSEREREEGGAGERRREGGRERARRLVMAHGASWSGMTHVGMG